jgi:hypothetical protein
MRLRLYSLRIGRAARFSSKVGQSAAELRKTATAQAAAERPKSSRPGARADEMAECAAVVEGGKSMWQRFMCGANDVVRPVASLLAPLVMPVLDAPSQRRVDAAVNSAACAR